MATFVLIHGAFRGGWAWDRVVPLLAGHQVVARSLPGAGERFDGTRPLVRLGDYVDDVLRWLDEIDEIDVIDAAGRTGGRAQVVLVGHSQGGVVALAVAAAAPDRVARVLLLDSPAPAPGTATAEVVPPEVRATYGDPPPPETWLEPTPMPVDPEHGLDEELVAWANPRLTPAPAGPAFDPLPFGGESVPITYAFFSRTPAYYPCRHTRDHLDAQGTAYTLIDAGHDAPLTHPEQVAALLLHQLA